MKITTLLCLNLIFGYLIILDVDVNFKTNKIFKNNHNNIYFIKIHIK